jgi:2-polyprenyl-3-methyl-5-hydroxy-6-metoxy-1,4-benzoquinol methylase
MHLPPSPSPTLTEYESVPCVLCGTNSAHVIAKRWQFNHHVYVSICPKDGLVYLNPRWTKSRYQHFYAYEYDFYYRSDEFSDDYADSVKFGKSVVIERRLKECGVTDFHSLLDIGTGMGWTLEYFSKRMSISTAAIESSEACIQYLQSNIGAEVLGHDVDSEWHRSHAGRFDVVIMRHVLEHFMDPIAVLTKVHHVLAPHGVLYLAVPDAMSPDEPMDSFYRIVHTYFFNSDTLTCATSRAGLRPLVLRSEGELWGVFRKSEPGQVQLPSTYDAQLDALRRFKRQHLWKEVVTYLPDRFAPQWLKRIVPDAVKTKLR